MPWNCYNCYYEIAIVTIMKLLWLLLWDCYDCYHGITIITAMIITIIATMIVNKINEG